MIISFYFLESGWNIQDNEKIKRRMKRIILPQIFWTVILWCCYNLLALLKLTTNIGIRGFCYQLLLGHSFNPPMWFQVDLIILTALYYFAKKLPDKYFVIIIITLVPVCLFLQYTGWNYYIFERFIYEVRYPLGRIVEVVPMCALGILCARYQVFNRLAKHKFLSVLVSWLVVCLSYIFYFIFGYSRKSLSF